MSTYILMKELERSSHRSYRARIQAAYRARLKADPRPLPPPTALEKQVAELAQSKTYSEIAADLGKSVNAVKQIAFRARRKSRC
jgi:hypothetical protein